MAEPIITADDVVRAGTCSGVEIEPVLNRLSTRIAAAMPVSQVLRLVAAGHRRRIILAAELDGSGYGYVYGHEFGSEGSDGSGDGSGDAYDPCEGYGSGNSDGDGFGDDTGNSAGDGYGAGLGYAVDSGGGHGDGCGDGSGSRSGSGYGERSGDGCCDGYGYGSGDGEDGLARPSHHGHMVCAVLFRRQGRKAGQRDAAHRASGLTHPVGGTAPPATS